MVRVLQCVSNMDRSGAETMIMNYYRRMDRTQVQFDFLCNKPKPGAYDEEIRQMGGRIFITPGNNPLKYRAYQRFMDDLFDAHPEYRILHTHNESLGAYPMDSAKRKGIPHRILHAHNTAFEVDLKAIVKWLCIPRIAHLCTDAWVCSRDAARFYIGERAVQEGRYRLVHNAIDPDRYTFNPAVREQIRAQYGLGDSVVIGHVGRFVKLKNHDFLLRVFASALGTQPNARLVLLGDGELMDAIKAQAEALGVADKVLFMGNVGNAHMWYQAFDAFVLPSSHEGLPLVGIEAQAAGLPCLFSDVVTRDASITDTTAFLSLKESPQVWASRILQAAAQTTRRDQRETLRAAGYDITVEAPKLQALYLSMAAKG